MIQGIKAIFEVVDRASAPIRRIAGVFRSINLGPLRDQLRTVMSAAKGVGAELGKMALAAGAGIAAAAAAGGAMLLKVADTAKEVRLGAEQIGMATKAFQGLGYAAERSGSNVEEFADAMKDFNEKIVEAASGDNKDLAAGFKKMGVGLKDARGQLRPTEAILMDVADAFARVPDGAKKSTAAMALMGDAGVKLIPLLNKGSGGIREIMAEAERLGLVLGDDALAGLTRFSTGMARVQAVVTGIQNAIAVALLPIVEPLINQFAEWAIVNRELIGTKIAEWVAAIPGVVQDAAAAFSAWSAALAPVTAAIGAMIDVVGPMNAGIGLTAALIGGKLLLTLWPLIKAVTTLGRLLSRLAIGPLVAMLGQLFTTIRGGMGVMAAFNVVLAANPIGAVILAVTALAGAAYVIYRNWGSVGPWFAGLWAGVKRAFNGFKEWVSGIFTGDFGRAADGVREAFAGLGDYLSTLWGGVQAAFEAFLHWVDGIFGTNLTGAFDSVKSAAKAVADWFSSDFGGLLKTGIDAAYGLVKPAVDLFSGAFDGVKAAGQAIADWFSSDFGGLLKTGIDAAYGLVKPAIDLFSGAFDGVKAAGQAIADWFSSDFGGLLKTGIDAAYGLIKPAIDLFSGAFDGVKAAGQAIADWFSSDFGGLLKTGIDAAYGLVKPAIDLFSGAFDGVKAAGQAIADWFSSDFGGLLKTGIDAAYGLVKPAIDLFSGAFDGVKAAGQAIADWFSSDFGGLLKTGIDAAYGLIKPAIDLIASAIGGIVATINGVITAAQNLSNLTITTPAGVAMPAGSLGRVDINRITKGMTGADLKAIADSDAGRFPAPPGATGADVPPLFGAGGRAQTPGSGGPPTSVDVGGTMDIRVNQAGQVTGARTKFNDTRIQPNVSSGLSNAMP